MFHLSLHLKEELFSFCYGMAFFGMFFSSGVYFICFVFVFFWGWLICLSVACNFRCVLFWVAN